MHPHAGFDFLCPVWERDVHAAAIAQEVAAVTAGTAGPTPSVAEISAAVRAALDADARAPLPFFSGWDGYDDCVLLGRFKSASTASTSAADPPPPLSGLTVTVLRAKYLTHLGARDFQAYEEVRHDGTVAPLDLPVYLQAPGYAATDDSGDGIRRIDTPNRFVLRIAFDYFEHWIRRDSMPPRSATFPFAAWDMSFAGELFELLHSRRAPPELTVDFLGLERCNDGMGFQSCLNACRRGVDHVAHLVSASPNGLADTDALVAALREDYNAWIACRPDVWPVRPAAAAAAAARQPLVLSAKHRAAVAKAAAKLAGLSTDAARAKLLAALPDAVLLALVDMQPPPVSLREADAAIRATVFLTGDEEAPTGGAAAHSRVWLLPVPTHGDEAARAARAFQSWLPPTGGGGGDHPADAGGPQPYAAAEFPWTEFLGACQRSDSMRSRRRLWAISRQFEEIWRSYREHGFEREPKFTNRAG
ncbi:hypothetical protein HK405_008819 [Cladochytrium tenue]|nr:hypothetical protein HK405_008819 [Cladochytrium tenue]